MAAKIKYRNRLDYDLNHIPQRPRPDSFAGTPIENNMNKSVITITTMVAAIGILAACGNSEPANHSNPSGTSATQSPAAGAGPADYDPKRGEGKFDDSNVKLGPIDQAMADKGKAISATKCNSCHKQTDEKLVGPGWKGVTERRTAPWIMNFITNPDAMIEKDPEAQAMLELCLVRMPNQNLGDEEAREILEYMRQVDGAK